MQVNSIKSNHSNSRPTFTGIKLLAGAEDTLKKQLNTSDAIQRFGKIVESHENDSFTDLYLFGDGEKLTARIIDMTSNTNSIVTQKKQPFWQSTISFLEKMSKKTTAIENDLTKKNNLENDLKNIIQNLDKI